MTAAAVSLSTEYCTCIHVRAAKRESLKGRMRASRQALPPGYSTCDALKDSRKGCKY